MDTTGHGWGSRPYVQRCGNAQGDVGRHGITVVELLVCCGIVALLGGLLVPAIQIAREASRRAHCRNNLKQLGLAMHLHHEALGHFATDGWGYGWVGDPDAGFGPDQPGGWIYNILPYIGEDNIRGRGRHLRLTEKRAAQAELLGTALSAFICPTRRAASRYPYTGTYPLRNVDTPREAAKSDYAVNAGDVVIVGGSGPVSANSADLGAYTWPTLRRMTGIAFVRSQVRLAEVRDGLSSTYLIGEKYLSFREYLSGNSPGDDQAMYLGDDADIRRWTADGPADDTLDLESKELFGSAHEGGCHFVLCDGSVRRISYDIAPAIHRWLGNRSDRQIVPEGAY